MATLTTALNTGFTPAATSFVVQCSGGSVVLQRRQTAGAAWVNVGEIGQSQALIVDNPVAGVEYRAVSVSGSPSFQADQ